MTCEFPWERHRVQKRPCTEEAMDRNWDAVISHLNRIENALFTLRDCPSTGGSGVRRFKLTAGLTLGGSAAAVLQEWSGGAWVDDGGAIVVKDVNQAPGFWQGSANYGGWCVPEEGSDTNYHIVVMEYIAQFIRYELTEALADVDAAATITAYSHGIDPGSSTTVYDPNLMFTHWHQIGCKGIAQWNDRAARYEIVVPQLVSMFLRATLTEDLCEGDTVAVVDIDEAIKQAYYDKMPNPEPTTATNTLEKKAIDGTAVWLRGEVKSGALVYDVIDVEKSKVNMVTHVKLIGCVLSYEYREVYVETCNVDDAAEIATFTQMDVPYQYRKESDYTGSGYCRIVADTKTICTIVVEEGPEITIAEAVRKQYLTDVYVTHDPSDDDDPETTPTCKIYGSKSAAWVLCAETDTTNHELIDLYIQDVVTGFRKDSTSESCVVYAETTKFCMIRPTIGGVPIDGADITVLTAVLQTVLEDVRDDGADILGDEVDVFVVCVGASRTVTLIETETCSDDEVIDEGVA